MNKFEKVTGYEVNLPVRATKHSAGYDMEAAETVVLKPFETKLIKTGIKADMEEGYYLQLAMRSSMSLKRKLIMTNGIGVIDKDYYNNEDNEGHIHCMVTNINENDVMIEKGERICQAIFVKHGVTDNDSAAGVRNGGFGSTGVSNHVEAIYKKIQQDRANGY